jgi:hypothetical protein
VWVQKPNIMTRLRNAREGGSRDASALDRGGDRDNSRHGSSVRLLAGIERPRLVRPALPRPLRAARQRACAIRLALRLSSAHAEGVRLGRAHRGVQVADRLRLWQNLAEPAERCVVWHRACLRPSGPTQAPIVDGDDLKAATNLGIMVDVDDLRRWGRSALEAMGRALQPHVKAFPMPGCRSRPVTPGERGHRPDSPRQGPTGGPQILERSAGPEVQARQSGRA